MPCRSDYMEPTRAEREASAGIASQLKHLADELTHSCDALREYLLGNSSQSEVMRHVNRDATRAKNALGEKAKKLYVQVPAGLVQHVEEMVIEYNWLNAFATRQEKMRPVDYETILADQIEHREQDLRRLLKTFAESVDRERLALVLSADKNKPLKPQLGFDPDDF